MLYGCSYVRKIGPINNHRLRGHIQPSRQWLSHIFSYDTSHDHGILRRHHNGIWQPVCVHIGADPLEKDSLAIALSIIGNKPGSYTGQLTVCFINHRARKIPGKQVE